jgi:mRNA interferase MazF
MVCLKRNITVVIPEGKGGLKANSKVNLARILTIDKGRLTKKLGYLDEEKMAEMDAALRISMGIKQRRKANPHDRRAPLSPASET